MAGASNKVITSALLARSVDYRDTDRICTLLTETHGKVSALARGARRSRKRFGAALGLFVVAEAELSNRRSNNNMMVLERFDCRQDLAPGIANDVVKMAHGSYMLEITREIWPEQQHEPQLFRLIVEGLQALAEGEASSQLLRSYELKLLAHAGFVPTLDGCARCGEPLESSAPVGFSVTQGGVICHRCDAVGWPLAADRLAGLIHLAAVPLTQASGVELTRQVTLDLRDLMIMVMRHHLGKDLKSLAFISQLGGF